MPNLTFNKKHFFKTLLIFLVLTIGWTILCIKTDEFTDRDKGLVSGLGFLLTFSASVYLGQPRKSFFSFLYLSIITIAVFLGATFVLGPLIALSINSMVLYAVVNSILVAITMTIAFNKIYGIGLKYQTITLAAILMMLGYLVFSKVTDYIHFKYDIHPRLIMFNFFQLLLIIPLTLGITVKTSNIQPGIPNHE
jgi:hypothetical protein